LSKTIGKHCEHRYRCIFRQKIIMPYIPGYQDEMPIINILYIICHRKIPQTTHVSMKVLQIFHNITDHSHIGQITLSHKRKFTLCSRLNSNKPRPFCTCPLLCFLFNALRFALLPSAFGFRLCQRQYILR